MKCKQHLKYVRHGCPLCSGSLVDPFYDDKKIHAALDKLTSK